MKLNNECYKEKNNVNFLIVKQNWCIKYIKCNENTQIV
jgi:hypothetical protein